MAVVAVLMELQQLNSLSLVNNTTAVLGLADLLPASTTLVGRGAALYTLMELWEVDQRDLTSLVQLLNQR